MNALQHTLEYENHSDNDKYLRNNKNLNFYTVIDNSNKKKKSLLNAVRHTQEREDQSDY